MEAAYDPESNYHTGSIPVQEAKAQLGVFKTTDDVPVRYRLRNYARELDSNEVWRAFLESLNKTWDETTEYRYWSPWNKWSEFAGQRDTNPVTPTAEDLDAWFEEAIDRTASIATCHDIHFRVLYRFFEWLTEHTDYPHRYNPVLQAVLLEGATEDLWGERVFRRKKYEDKRE